jgi:hypothetical protein
VAPPPPPPTEAEISEAAWKYETLIYPDPFLYNMSVAIVRSLIFNVQNIIFENVVFHLRRLDEDVFKNKCSTIQG